MRRDTIAFGKSLQLEICGSPEQTEGCTRKKEFLSCLHVMKAHGSAITDGAAGIGAGFFLDTLENKRIFWLFAFREAKVSPCLKA
jgi:hypothetical protein